MAVENSGFSEPKGIRANLEADLVLVERDLEALEAQVVHILDSKRLETNREKSMDLEAGLEQKTAEVRLCLSKRENLLAKLQKFE